MVVKEISRVYFVGMDTAGFDVLDETFIRYECILGSQRLGEGKGFQVIAKFWSDALGSGVKVATEADITFRRRNRDRWREITPGNGSTT